MDQDKTTVMGGYGSPRTGNGADETRVVPNTGYAAPDTTQASADPTRVVNYGNAAQEPYREYPKSIPQYGEDEEKKPSRSSSVIKKILIVLAIFFALSVVFAIVSGMLNKRGTTTDTTAEQTETTQSGTVDLSDIPGQYWSNAKKLLKSRGADLSNAVILTDDGSTPVVDANCARTARRAMHPATRAARTARAPTRWRT